MNEITSLINVLMCQKNGNPGKNDRTLSPFNPQITLLAGPA